MATLVGVLDMWSEAFASQGELRVGGFLPAVLGLGFLESVSACLLISTCFFSHPICRSTQLVSRFFSEGMAPFVFRLPWEEGKARSLLCPYLGDVLLATFFLMSFSTGISF